MLRGEIRLVDFGAALPGEAAEQRPAVLVSNDRANAVAARLGRGVVTVVPITSNTDLVLPFQVLVDPDASGLRTESKLQGEQVRSVSVARVGPALGRLPADLTAALDDALRLQLAL